MGTLVNLCRKILKLSKGSNSNNQSNSSNDSSNNFLSSNNLPSSSNNSLLSHSNSSRGSVLRSSNSVSSRTSNSLVKIISLESPLGLLHLLQTSELSGSKSEPWQRSLPSRTPLTSQEGLDSRMIEGYRDLIEGIVFF